MNPRCITNVVVTICLLGAIRYCAGLPSSAGINERPIIGILTQPTRDEFIPFGHSRVQAGYVKWLESSGARVAPVYFDAPEHVHRKMFESVNGIVFTGGDTDLITSNNTYNEAALRFLRWSVEATAKGDYFPVWGTCLGFQQLAIVVSGNYTLMGTTVFSSENESLPLHFTPAARGSRMFQGLSEELYDELRVTDLTDNEHHNAVTPVDYYNSGHLRRFFEILSTNVDRDGREFISTWEGRDFPVYGTQWHPERAEFEWSTHLNMSHSLDAIRVSQYVGTFFVSEARKSLHHFPSDEVESASLIYEYNVTYTNVISHGDYVQTYFMAPYQQALQVFQEPLKSWLGRSLNL